MTDTLFSTGQDVSDVAKELFLPDPVLPPVPDADAGDDDPAPIPANSCSHHLLWLLIIVIPALSLSMMGEAVDFRVMNNATRKTPKDVTKEVCT